MRDPRLPTLPRYRNIQRKWNGGRKTSQRENTKCLLKRVRKSFIAFRARQYCLIPFFRVEAPRSERRLRRLISWQVGTMWPWQRGGGGGIQSRGRRSSGHGLGKELSSSLLASLILRRLLVQVVQQPQPLHWPRTTQKKH